MVITASPAAVLQPTNRIRFQKRKVNKFNPDGSQKYFRILQQLWTDGLTGAGEWRDVEVVEEPIIQ